MRWLVVVAACGGGRTEPPPAGSAAPVVARADAAVAVDARPGAPIDAPIDAPLDAATDALVSGTVPDFGCFAWSPSRELAACIVGSRGWNMGETKVQLVFVPLRDGVTAPPELVLVEANDTRGPNDLPPAVAAQLAEAVRGFTALAPAGQITSGDPGDRFRFGPAIDVGGVRLAATAASAPRISIAPCYHTTVIASFRHGGSRVLSDQTDSIGHLEVRAYVAGGAVLIDQVTYTGDEGVHGGYGDVWRCNRESCGDAE